MARATPPTYEQLVDGREKMVDRIVNLERALSLEVGRRTVAEHQRDLAIVEMGNLHNELDKVREHV